MHIYFKETEKGWGGVHHEKHVDRWFFMDKACKYQMVDGVYVVDEDETKISYPENTRDNFIHSPIYLAETLTLERVVQQHKKPLNYPIAYHTFESGQMGFIFPEDSRTLKLFTDKRLFSDPIELPTEDLHRIEKYDMFHILNCALDAEDMPSLWDMLPLMDSSLYLGKLRSFKWFGHIVEVKCENAYALSQYPYESYYYMWINGKSFVNVTKQMSSINYNEVFISLSNMLPTMTTFCREHFICINNWHNMTWTDEPAHRFTHIYHKIRTNQQHELCDIQIRCTLFNPYNVDEDSFVRLFDEVEESFYDCEKRCQDAIESKGLTQKITARDLLP